MRRARQLYAALVVAVVAVTMAILNLSAVFTGGRDSLGTGIVIVAALWIPWQLITAACYRRP